MKHFFSFSVAILFTVTTNAQYYYNDIVANQQTNSNYKQLRSNKIRNVKAISKDAREEIVEGFYVQQEFNNDGSKATTTTATSEGLSSTMTSYYESGKIIKTEEKTNNVNTSVDYAYDAEGRLISIVSSSADTVINGYSKEEHLWSYNPKGQIEQMLKIKNGKDTTRIVIVYDENGNVGIEQWRRNNRIMETYYYYYDAGKRITDIVRYNQDNGKMLPDCLYEYDAEGRVTKMTQVRTGGSNYLLWKYTYNEKGLKAKEACFDKSKRVLGTMEYSYN